MPYFLNNNAAKTLEMNNLHITFYKFIRLLFQSPTYHHKHQSFHNVVCVGDKVAADGIKLLSESVTTVSKGGMIAHALNDVGFGEGSLLIINFNNRDCRTLYYFQSNTMSRNRAYRYIKSLFMNVF